MPWNDYPLQSIEIPSDHANTGPYIYIGTGDPLAADDAAIVYHFGTHNSAFLIGLIDEKTPHDDGHFQILARSDEGLGNTIALVDLDYAPFNNVINLAFGCQRAHVYTQLFGETVYVQDLGNGIKLNPYASGLGTSAGLTVDVGDTGTPELSVNNNGITMRATAGNLTLKADQAGNAVHLNAQTVEIDNDALIDSHSHRFLPGETGTVLVTVSGANSAVINVTFAHPFATTPVVMTNLASGAGPVAFWDTRAITITSTGFQLFVFNNTTSTFSNIPVQWVAMEAL